MNRLIRMLLHPLHHSPERDVPMSRGPPPLRSGWPSLAVPTGTHRRSSDATPWHADGPVDPWKRPPGPLHWRNWAVDDRAPHRHAANSPDAARIASRNRRAERRGDGGRCVTGT